MLASICIFTSSEGSDFDSTDDPVVVPIAFGICKKQRWAKPSFHSKAVSQQKGSKCVWGLYSLGKLKVQAVDYCLRTNFLL